MPNDTPLHWYHRKVARRRFPLTECSVKHIGGCGGPLERHHRDEDFTNNVAENVVILCRSHHKLIHSGALDLSNPVMPAFYVDKRGDRRYAHTLAHQRRPK